MNDGRTDWLTGCLTNWLYRLNDADWLADWINAILSSNITNSTVVHCNVPCKHSLSCSCLVLFQKFPRFVQDSFVFVRNGDRNFLICYAGGTRMNHCGLWAMRGCTTHWWTVSRWLRRKNGNNNMKESIINNPLSITVSFYFKMNIISQAYKIKGCDKVAERNLLSTPEN